MRPSKFKSFCLLWLMSLFLFFLLSRDTFLLGGSKENSVSSLQANEKADVTQNRELEKRKDQAAEKTNLEGDSDRQKEKKTNREDKSGREDKKYKEEQQVLLHNEIVVTATRMERPVFKVPKPVSVVKFDDLQAQAPNNIADLLPELPGSDVVGVGANQTRPVIRGLRGQRILLLTDGIRLSNSRRTQTFGEIPSLIDVAKVERVEVVRGPASVLYGSEAIGGVINIITRHPEYGFSGTRVAGDLGYRYSSADSQHKFFANINGHVGRLSFMLGGTYRQAQDYIAPAGTFGQITLNKENPVHDTGVKDHSLDLFLGYRFADGSNLALKFDDYRARNAGFGYIDPEVYSPGSPTIRLLYPRQDFQKFSLSYEKRSIRFFLADGVSFVAYYLKNSRDFISQTRVTLFQGAEINVNSNNFTDVKTFGSRFELTKVFLSRHIFTYGLDFYRDDSYNTDYSSTEVSFFGRKKTSFDPSPKVPNAFFWSGGIFAQDEMSLGPKLSLILGVRYQHVAAQTKNTPGFAGQPIKSRKDTLVGALNFLYSFNDHLVAVVSLGRGFRAANLPELFYQGITPDGGGYQIPNPNLRPESSFNLDLGWRLQFPLLYFESTYFRNLVYNGIQIQFTGRKVGGLPEYQNVNVDKLRIQGVEVTAQWNLPFRLFFNANYSYLRSKNLTNPELMFADTYGSRLNLSLRYSWPKNFFWLEYHVRINGDQKDVNLGNNPVGSNIPGFTVHSLRAGFNLFPEKRFKQKITIGINNLTNTLYSEFSNASFFRPAPKRQIILTWATGF